MTDTPDVESAAHDADEPRDSPARVWITVGLFVVFVVLAGSCTALWELF
ncbi:MAG: hypothetical protein QM611_03890 [Microbacterium sp.]